MKLLLVFLIAVGNDFVKHEPNFKEYDSGRGRIVHEDSIPLKEALAFHKYFLNKAKVDPVPYISRVPGDKTLYIVSAWTPGPNPHPERRLYLLRRIGNRIQEVFASKSFGDTWIQKPTYFVGDNRILLLVEIGAEEYFALEALEYSANKMKYLGRLDVGRKMTGVSPPMFENPLSDATVKFGNGGYSLTLRGEIYRNPGLASQKKISDSKGNATLLLRAE